MRRLIIALAAAAPLALAVGAAQAGAVGGATALSPDTAAGVAKVHGGHGRACAFGPIYRWNTRARHRHVNGEVRICGNRWRGGGLPPRYRQRGCFAVGPVWYCP